MSSAAVAAFLLGGGTAIGIAVSGGASAAPTSARAAHPGPAARMHCARMALGLKRTGHAAAANRAAALCRIPLLRLAASGGLHGEVTFQGKNGINTTAFERGTVASVTGTTVTVTAKDGVTWTWDLKSGTIFLSAGKRLTSSSLAKGDLVFVGGPVAAGARDARLIRIQPSAG